MMFPCPDTEGRILSGATYFFTIVTYLRQPILTKSKVRIALRDAIETVREKLPFTIDAWVLLPDHLQAIWTLPENNTAFGKRWGMIKAHVSRSCGDLIEQPEPRSASRIKRREIDFWQRRFWEHQIRDDADFERCVDYIHYNPVKHRLVKNVKDWPYSTFHRYVNRGDYAQNWSVDPGTVIANLGE